MIRGILQVLATSLVLLLAIWSAGALVGLFFLGMRMVAGW